MPSARTVITSGSSWPTMREASVLGRSTGTPTVNSGAVIMNTTSRTSMTSTIGVTLISLIGWKRLARRPDRAEPDPLTWFAIDQPFASAWRDKMAPNSPANASSLPA